MLILDTKVHGTIVRNKDGMEIPPDEFVVFRPGDDALLPTLEYYRQRCQLIGAKEPQLRAVDDLIERVARWRSLNPGRCKVPDVDPGELRGG